MTTAPEIIIAPPKQTELLPQPVHAEPKPSRFADTSSLPMGRVAYARCGDKGGNSNVGIWAPNQAAWPWLQSTLSTEKFRQLFPDAGNLKITRHEFPQLRAVHFIVHGLFGNGGSSNLRPDQIGKAIGEYILARNVEMPSEILVD